MATAIQGTYAAVLTPRTETGEIDETAFRGLLEFLLGNGITGFAINGATGEFCLTSEEELHRLLGIASETLAGKANVLVGIGSPSAPPSIRLGRVATKFGAAGLLLPMPYFFPYSQEDLKVFCRTVVANVEAPVLLYNLPQFTSGLEPQTSLQLIQECDGIIGIKDSSGSLDTLRLLTETGTKAQRIVGNDDVLVPALEQGLLDAVVSGVACVLPELIGRLYELGSSNSDSSEFRILSSALASFTQQLQPFPTPWGLKIVAEARGVLRATYPIPLSHERESAKAAMLNWFRHNQPQLLAQ
ncbi:MAG TPA: dihydrodipicolinate synthase family protein [Acidobacteriaceae bacterium]